MPASRAIIQTQVLRNQITPSETLEVDSLSALRMALEAGLGCAVLVPDGPSWRVSGGVGLRPLERRLVLQDEHWLVAEIALGGREVLDEDTDMIRQQLSGAPLAAWRYLLAVPIPDVQGIVVLARGQEGGQFTDRELSLVIGPVREAAPLLGQAIEIRRLARLLGPLREMEWENPRRAD